MKQKTKYSLIGGACIGIAFLGFVFLWRISTVPPSLEVTLISAPKLQSKLAVFHHYGPEQTLIEETQQFYHAELEFKNLGPGQIYFPYKGIFSLEIQKTNSSEWQGANQYSFSTYPPPLKVNASQTYGLRIPITAQNWRVTATYRRWRYPVKLINGVFRDLIGTGEIFDDDKDYDFTSTVWKLPPPPRNQLTSKP
jgi:hypothetical protein